jgi:hypothetical protein
VTIDEEETKLMLAMIKDKEAIKSIAPSELYHYLIDNVILHKNPFPSHYKLYLITPFEGNKYVIIGFYYENELFVLPKTKLELNWENLLKIKQVLSNDPELIKLLIEEL